MRNRAIGSSLAAALAAATLAVAAAGCGSSSDSSSASSAGGGGGAKADVGQAQQLLAPYTGRPSAFPVDEPLPKALPAGTEVGFLQCVTPICGLFAQALAPAAKDIGAQLEVVKAGAGANDLQTAMSSLIEKRPTGLVLPGIEPSSISGQLAQAKSAGITMVSNGVMDAEKYGVGGQTLGRPAAELVGQLLAAWSVQRKGGRNTVFYNTPELSFSGPVKDGFQEEFKRLCPSCTARVVDVPVATIGNTAPSLVASDLQSHPKTGVAVFASAEAATGLPPALRTAGLSPETIGFAPGPANLQDIKEGKITAGLAVDLPTVIYTLVDAMARLKADAPLTDGERSTIPVMQVLEAKDLPGDVSKGWSGYPDVAARFKKLWAVG
jgi:ribose transport system substrate-binding protein